MFKPVNMPTEGLFFGPCQTTVRAVDTPTPAKRPRSGERAYSRPYLLVTSRSSVRRLVSTARTFLTLKHPAKQSHILLDTRAKIRACTKVVHIVIQLYPVLDSRIME
jgi:hypothetical protein